MRAVRAANANLATATVDVDAPVPAARNSVRISGAAQPRTISRAASEAGVHVETIRYYERLGLIARPRPLSSNSAHRYRVYPDETVRRLRFVRNAQQMGFSLKEIGELAGMTTTGATCAEMCARMDEKLVEMDKKIAQLQKLRGELARLLKASPRQGSYENCEVCKDLAS